MPEEQKKRPQIDPARAVSASYPSNSKKARKEGESEDLTEKHVTQLEGVTVVKVQKPSMARRMRDAFTGEEASSIGEYLLLQVAIPAFKNTLYDLITGGANRALFGNNFTQQPGANQRRTGNVNYNQISRNQVNPVQPVMPVQDRARHNFNSIVFGTRQEAEQVLSALLDLIDRYEVAAITDMYELVGITGSFADDKYGWFNLNGATIVPARGGGFMLDMPAPTVIR